jgi:protein gp37
MNKTAIEWTNYTWNPITGCDNNCSYCFARRIATRFAGSKAFPHGFAPTFHPDRLIEPLSKKVKSGTKIFVCDMGELFATGHEDWTEQVLNAIKKRPDVNFQLLTKQPQNLVKFSPFPSNCWVGFSATNYSSFWRGLDNIRDIHATVKYVSIEPLLEEIHSNILPARCFPSLCGTLIQEGLTQSGINLLIIGCETLNGKPVREYLPKIEWIKEIVDAADKARAAVFLKDNLRSLFLPQIKVSDPMPGIPNYALRENSVTLLRQEFPVIKSEVSHG